MAPDTTPAPPRAVLAADLAAMSVIDAWELAVEWALYAAGRSLSGEREAAQRARAEFLFVSSELERRAASTSPEVQR